jgi:hypothetical protein
MAGPYNFESQKITARNLVLSPNKQLAYGTPIATASMTRRQKFDGSAVAELKPAKAPSLRRRASSLVGIPPSA